MAKKQNTQPDLTLNMDDKIYLAVAKDFFGKKAFVYTLACLREANNPNSINLAATREINTFNNKESAELYYETIEKIVELNTYDESKNVLFKANEKVIERFLNSK